VLIPIRSSRGNNNPYPSSDARLNMGVTGGNRAWQYQSECGGDGNGRHESAGPAPAPPGGS